MKRNVVIIAPHQDDETIGCGGLIQKVTASGGHVHIAIVTKVDEGVKFDSMASKYHTYAGAQRDRETKCAIQKLTKKPGTVTMEYYFGGEFHHRLDRLGISDIIASIEKTILQYKPDVLLIPAETWDQDHRLSYQACLSVIRPHFFNGAVVVYEVLGEMGTFVPNMYISMDQEQAQCKIDAFSCYSSQNSQEFHTVSSSSLHYKMHYRGRSVFREYAEAYMVLRAVDNLVFY